MGTEKALIAETLASFSLDDYRPIHPRDLDLGKPLKPKAGNLVTAITGMRRAGKSYRLFQEMDALLQSGVSSEQILYFNFEDDRLAPVTPEVGDLVLESFFAIHPIALKKGAYFFFDELQEMENWGTWLRRVVDTNRATIYVTGSSSRMLSREISTEFRGRSISYEQAPYSFVEYAKVRSPRLDLSQQSLSRAARLATQDLLATYLDQGGFPAALELSNSQRIHLLQSYVQRVVARDVVERNNLSKPQVATLFAQTCIGLNGRGLSLRKIANDFKSRGLTTNRTSLSDMLGYFEDAFLVHTVKERSRALRENDNTLPKVYVVDPGLFCANAPASVSDEGQRMEQVVYLELRRRENAGRRGSISFLKTEEHGYEVDFAVGDAVYDDGLALYQVAENLDSAEVRDRETRALWEAMRERGCQRSMLIVGDGVAEALEQDGFRIDVVPLWDWLKNNK